MLIVVLIFKNIETIKIHSSCMPTSLSWCFPDVCKHPAGIKTKQNQTEQNNNEKRNSHDKALTGELH